MPGTKDDYIHIGAKFPSAMASERLAKEKHPAAIRTIHRLLPPEEIPHILMILGITK